jgi:hypothetical protein
MENTALGLTDAQIALIQEWTAAKMAAKIQVDLERTLRAEIVKQLFDASIDKGTEYAPLANGYKLKCVKSLDYKLTDPVKVKEICDALPTSLSALLVKWKPELSSAAYNKLTDVEQALFNDVLEIKPGSPQVSLEEPKAAK